MKTRLPRKALSLFLALVMMLSLLPTMAWAEDGETYVAQIGDTKYETLQAAVSAAQDGDTITVLAGTYGADKIGTLTTAEAGQVRYKSLTIQPAGGATVKFTADVYVGYDDGKTSDASMTVTGLSFEDASLKIDNYANVSVTNCSFKNAATGAVGDLYISDSCSKGEYASNQVTVTSCQFDGSAAGASAIRLRNTGNVTLSDNTILNSNFNGILFESNTSIKNDSAKTISITGNTITKWNANDEADQGRAIRMALGTLPDGSTVSITGNTFRKTTLGLDKPDFMKITEAGNATVNLNGNDWNDELLSTVSGKSDYYTVNGIAPTLNSVITTKSDPTVTYVAQIGDQGYETLQDAINAAQNGETIELLDDVAFGEFEGTALSIPTGKNFTLDLAGKTISGTATNWNTQLISVGMNSTVTIMDSQGNGVISYDSTKADFDFWHGNYTINNAGTLNLKSGRIENLTKGGASYAVENHMNWQAEDVTFNMEGGVVTCPDGDQAVRLYSNWGGTMATVGKSIMNMTGGTIEAGGIWCNDQVATGKGGYIKLDISGGTINGMLDFIGAKDQTVVNISGGTFDCNKLRLRDSQACENTEPYLNITGGQWKIAEIDNQNTGETTTNTMNITGGVFNFNGNEVVKTTAANFIVEGKEFVPNTNAQTKDTYPWTIGVAATPVCKIGTQDYETLAAAVAAVNDGQTIEILCDIPDAVGMTINNGKTFTIDFKSHTYTVGKPGAGSTGTKTQGFQIIKDSNVTFKDGTIKVDPANKDVTWKKEATEKGIAWLINNYGNMTLTNMTINGENLAHNFATVGGQEAAGTPRYVINNNTNSMTMTGGSITAAAGDVAVSANWYDSPSYPDHPAVTLTNATIAGKVEAIAGTVDFNGNTTVDGMVRVGENGKDGDKKTPGTPGAVVTIENGAKVINNNYVAVFGANTLNVYGEVNGCVSTNGNAYNAGSVINIYDGAVVTNNEAGVESGDAIYMPNGTLNVYGGTITGTTAVYFKSTTLNITGGTFIGTGAKVNYQYYGNGGIATGDALVIDSCNYPSGISGVSVSGGSFKSEHANAVMSFVSKGAVEVKNFISGGLFSTAPEAAYVVEGKAVVNNPDAVTKEAYPFTIGVKEAKVVIKDGEGEAKVATDVSTTTDYKVVENAAVDLTTEQKTAIATKTEVKGVELKKDASVGTGDNKVTGVQAVINAAKAQATETAASGSDAEKTAAAAFNAAVEAANNTDTVVTVKVDVEVKPTEFNTTNEIKFELKPVATVTIQNGTAAAATQTVDVTNDMIDQEQDIEVSIYTGAKPAQILHKEGDKVIDSFTGNQIVFDEATGVSKVIIHHFSDLVAVMQNSAVVTYVAKNVQTDTQYTTLTQALTEAQSGQTVELLENITDEAFVTVNTGVTLDLKGHNITGATLIYNNGAIEDATGSGYIKADAYTFVNSESDYFAVYDNTVQGYRFVDTIKILSAYDSVNENMFRFHLDKNVTNVTALKSLLLSAVNNGKLKVYVIVETPQTQSEHLDRYSFYSQYVQNFINGIGNTDLYAIFENLPTDALVHAQIASVIGNNNTISVVNGTKK